MIWKVIKLKVIIIIINAIKCPIEMHVIQKKIHFFFINF